MKISVICSSSGHPIYPYLETWVESHASNHDAALVSASEDLLGGNILFLISCSEIIDSEIREKYEHSLVVHASALPNGRGWSPHIWQIVEGNNTIPVTLLEAEDKIDSGAIWAQESVHLEGHELFDEINSKLFEITLQLMTFAVDNASAVKPRRQVDAEPTYYRQRTAEDSRLDPNRTIAEQFELLRVADPERFPCFIEHRGKRYVVTLRKRK
jgi:methionyl-tRNA formyltransferase